MKRLFLNILALVLLLVSASACSLFKKNVSSFEKQNLSIVGMNFIENSVEEASMQHMFNAREGSVGGFGGAGGGCGCN